MLPGPRRRPTRSPVTRLQRLHHGSRRGASRELIAAHFAVRPAVPVRPCCCSTRRLDGNPPRRLKKKRGAEGAQARRRPRHCPRPPRCRNVVVHVSTEQSSLVRLGATFKRAMPRSGRVLAAFLPGSGHGNSTKRRPARGDAILDRGRAPVQQPKLGLGVSRGEPAVGRHACPTCHARRRGNAMAAIMAKGPSLSPTVDPARGARRRGPAPLLGRWTAAAAPLAPPPGGPLPALSPARKGRPFSAGSRVAARRSWATRADRKAKMAKSKCPSSLPSTCPWQWQDFVNSASLESWSHRLPMRPPPDVDRQALVASCGACTGIRRAGSYKPDLTGGIDLAPGGRDAAACNHGHMLLSPDLLPDQPPPPSPLPPRPASSYTGARPRPTPASLQRTWEHSRSAGGCADVTRGGLFVDQATRLASRAMQVRAGAVRRLG